MRAARDGSRLPLSICERYAGFRFAAKATASCVCGTLAPCRIPRTRAPIFLANAALEGSLGMRLTGTTVSVCNTIAPCQIRHVAGANTDMRKGFLLLLVVGAAGCVDATITELGRGQFLSVVEQRGGIPDQTDLTRRARNAAADRCGGIDRLNVIDLNGEDLTESSPGNHARVAMRFTCVTSAASQASCLPAGTVISCPAQVRSCCSHRCGGDASPNTCR
jgi:hypothetical protein